MKDRNWFWGLFFLAAGGLIIVNQLGYFTGINLITLIFTIMLVAVILGSLRHFNFAGILFPIALLAIVYSDTLKLSAITPWPVLITAAFGTIGLEMLFGKLKRKWWHGNNEHFDRIIDEPDESVVKLKVSFGSSIKYVNSDNFKKGYFSCSFGAMKIYFDNAKLSKEGAEIELDASFSGVELYIPKNWKVVNKVHNTLSGIDERCPRTDEFEGTVILKGDISFSGVQITRV